MAVLEIIADGRSELEQPGFNQGNNSCPDRINLFTFPYRNSRIMTEPLVLLPLLPSPGGTGPDWMTLAPSMRHISFALCSSMSGMTGAFNQVAHTLEQPSNFSLLAGPLSYASARYLPLSKLNARRSPARYST